MTPFRRSLAFLFPLAIFLAIAGFLFKGLSKDPSLIPSPLIDKPAPDFRITSLEDPKRLVDRKDMLGKVWLLNTWASWCEACREEHPVLLDYTRSAGIPIVGLDYKDTRVDGIRWLAQFGNPYIVSAYDESGRVGIDYGVYGVPETFVIDKLGIVRYKHVGAVTPEVLHDKLVPLINRLNA